MVLCKMIHKCYVNATRSWKQETHWRKRQRTAANPTCSIRRKMPLVNSTLFFSFVYHVSCLPWFETKNKIRCIDAPKYAFTHRNLPESEKNIWIFQNVHEKSQFFYISITRDNRVSCNQTLGCLRPYGDSWVSRAQPRINAFEILLQHNWLLFFLDIIDSQKHIATYNFHIK